MSYTERSCEYCGAHIPVGQSHICGCTITNTVEIDADELARLRAQLATAREGLERIDREPFEPEPSYGNMLPARELWQRAKLNVRRTLAALDGTGGEDG